MQTYGRVEVGSSHCCTLLRGHNHSNNKPAVGDLLRWHNDVDGLEVMTQVMAHKDAARVHQVAQLEVGLLHGGQVVGGHLGVQITRHLHTNFQTNPVPSRTQGGDERRGDEALNV